MDRTLNKATAIADWRSLKQISSPLLRLIELISALMAISGILSAVFIIGIGELKQRL